MKDLAGTIAIGLVFGFALHRIGFGDWDQVHAMFTLTDGRLIFGFALAVALLAASWVVIARVQRPSWVPRKLHPGTIPGGLLFGTGWALSGCCPSIALVQLGSGKLLALVTLVGILAGNALYPVVHRRFFRWSAGGCVDR